MHLGVVSILCSTRVYALCPKLAFTSCLPRVKTYHNHYLIIAYKKGESHFLCLTNIPKTWLHLHSGGMLCIQAGGRGVLS